MVKEIMSVWQGRVFGGYPGLKFISPMIAEYIPKCVVYVEPFAGMGSVSRHVTAEKKILNDMSDYSIYYCKHNFPDTIVTQVDFKDCLKEHDSKDTFFLIDPPWRTEIYKPNQLTYCNLTALEYYKTLLELLPTIKGDWILCGDQRRTSWNPAKNSSYYKIRLSGNRKVLFGNVARVNLISNKPFIRYNQAELIIGTTDFLKCSSCNGEGRIRNKYEGEIVMNAEFFPCKECGGTGTTKQKIGDAK